jgi:hypothetical protein
VPRLTAPPSVPQLGWHTPAKIPTPSTASAPAAPAAPSGSRPAVGLAAKAGKFIALAERMTATGEPTAEMPRFLQELDAVADQPTDQATQTDFPDPPAAPAAGSAESAAAVANLTAMLQRFSLWEADWSTDDLHPLLERLEQLTAQAAAPPDTSALLEQFEARFADLSKRLSDYQLNARVVFRNIDGRFQGIDARLNDGDKRSDAADKRSDAADKQLTVLGSRAVEAQDTARNAHSIATAASEQLASLQKLCDSQQVGLGKAYDICSNLLQRVNNSAARLDSRVDSIDNELSTIYDATKALLLNTEEGALARAQDTLAQVTDLHGRVLSLVEPQNRLNYEELYQRIKTISDLAQKHDTVKTKVLWQANEHLQLDRTRHVDTVALVLSFVVQCKPLN